MAAADCGRLVRRIGGLNGAIHCGLIPMKEYHGGNCMSFGVLLQCGYPSFPAAAMFDLRLFVGSRSLPLPVL